MHAALRAGNVPAVTGDEELLVPLAHVAAVRNAIAWAATAKGPATDEEPLDPSLTRGLAPLVAPSRPPLAAGRLRATRYRRLAGGVVDAALTGAPLVIAIRAGVPWWAAAAAHALLTVAPTALWGWTIGKRACGTRIIAAATLHRPTWLLAVVRWATAAAPLVVGAAVGVEPDLLAGLVLLVHAPILKDLRSVPDRAARTLVVEANR